jgi:hypothetical protein
VKRLKTRTCEGGDGTYKITHAVALGEVVSASDPVLAGKLHFKSVHNDTEDLDGSPARPISATRPPVPGPERRSGP